MRALVIYARRSYIVEKIRADDINFLSVPIALSMMNPNAGNIVFFAPTGNDLYKKEIQCYGSGGAGVEYLSAPVVTPRPTCYSGIIL